MQLQGDLFRMLDYVEALRRSKPQSATARPFRDGPVVTGLVAEAGCERITCPVMKSLLIWLRGQDLNL